MDTTNRAAGTVAALNLRSMAALVVDAYERSPRSNSPALDGLPSAQRATTLLHAWASLTGTTRDPDEALELARSIATSDEPAALLTGTDPFDHTEYLVTVWPTGHTTAARRADSYATWGVPADLHPAP